MNKELTNRDISEGYRKCEFWLFPSDITAAFAYWVVKQNLNDTFVSDKPTEAYSKFIAPFFDNPKISTKFTYQQLSDIVHETVFVNIPEILALNEMEPDFIDLGALARNVFYTILREQITSGYFDKKAILPISEK